MSKRAVFKIEEIAKKHENETVVIGTHGGAVRAIVNFYKNVPIDEVPYVPNCSVTVAEYENGEITFSQIGYCDFLEYVTELKF